MMSRVSMAAPSPISAPCAPHARPEGRKHSLHNGDMAVQGPMRCCSCSQPVGLCMQHRGVHAGQRLRAPGPGQAARSPAGGSGAPAGCRASGRLSPWRAARPGASLCRAGDPRTPQRSRPPFCSPAWHMHFACAKHGCWRRVSWTACGAPGHSAVQPAQCCMVTHEHRASSARCGQGFPPATSGRICRRRQAWGGEGTGAARCCAWSARTPGTARPRRPATAAG